MSSTETADRAPANFTRRFILMLREMRLEGKATLFKTIVLDVTELDSLTSSDGRSTDSGIGSKTRFD